MQLPLPVRRGVSRRPSRAPARLRVEALESRSLLSAVPGPALSLVGPNDPGDTLDRAAPLGDLSTAPSIRVDAAIGDSAAGAADVDWYAFTLDRPAAVALTADGASGARPPVLSLYVRDPYDPGDPATFLGVRQLAQAAGTDPVNGTQLDRALAAGSYYLAASGAGNTLFSPFLADSGYDGQAGNYQLQLAATDLGFGPADGPTVLASDPAPGSTLDRSPTVLRLDLGAALDPTTVLPGDDVTLTRNPAGTFGDGHDQDVPLAAFHFSGAATELQLTPAAPLAPGYYRLWLAGNAGANLDVLSGPDGTSLGADALHPAGQDFVLTFHVDGIEGNTGAGAVADDTPAGAHDLGDVSDGRLVQAAGTIGDDPTDPVPFDPSGVDLYHFRVSGPGRYAFAAEVFAQRIDSPLNAAVSLFVLDPASGRLRLLTADDDTLNPVKASDNRSLPLFSDPAIFAGLTAGDYYVAVSSHKNVPDPNNDLLPGEDGIFDPDVSHSGSAGRSRGDYVLNLRVQPDDVPPRVVAVAPAAGSTLDAAPTTLTVTFDGPVNLQQLAYAAYQRAGQGNLASVYVRGADGALYYPRLQSYDPTTAQATFLMLDRLPPGAYQLHLSGPLGLADLAGNPLVGNDPGGDFVVSFTVGGPAAPPHADQEPNDDPARPQDLGVLFPHELEGAGYAIARDFTADPAGAPADSADGYRFAVLQPQNYFLFLGGASLPRGVRLTLTDASGAPVVAQTLADGVSLWTFLVPGTYAVRVSGWSPASAAGVAYTLRVALGGSADNPQPLTLGPAPVLRLSLAPPPPPAPVAAPRVEVAASGAQPAPAPVAEARGAVPAAAKGPGAPVEAPSGLLAALGAGPVGGVGGGTGGNPEGTPLLSLGALSAAAPSGLTPEGGGRPAGAVAAAREGLAGSPDEAAPASPPAGNRWLVRAAAAAVVRLIDFGRWLEMSFTPAGPGDGENGPRRPDEVLPPAEAARGADPATSRVAEPGLGAADTATAAGLAALAGAIAGPVGERRRRTPPARTFLGARSVSEG